MGNIGITEIVLILVVLALPLAVLTVLLFVLLAARRKAHDLVECRACRKRISPRAETCPSCGEPRLPLRG